MLFGDANSFMRAIGKAITKNTAAATADGAGGGTTTAAAERTWRQHRGNKISHNPWSRSLSPPTSMMTLHGVQVAFSPFGPYPLCQRNVTCKTIMDQCRVKVRERCVVGIHDYWPNPTTTTTIMQRHHECRRSLITPVCQSHPFANCSNCCPQVVHTRELRSTQAPTVAALSSTSLSSSVGLYLGSNCGCWERKVSSRGGW
jgi:hypothetical protein